MHWFWKKQSRAVQLDTLYNDFTWSRKDNHRKTSGDKAVTRSRNCLRFNSSMTYFLHMTFLFYLHAVMSTLLVTLHSLCTLHSDVTLKQMRHAAQ
jgi:hypothetical protein